MAAHGWVAGIAGHGSGSLSRDLQTSQAPNLHLAMQLLNRNFMSLYQSTFSFFFFFFVQCSSVPHMSCTSFPTVAGL